MLEQFAADYMGGGAPPCPAAGPAGPMAPLALPLAAGADSGGAVAPPPGVGAERGGADAATVPTAPGAAAAPGCV
eukprot:CAMPEP_0182528646 /NCGR_PEP_ID=MMETSP1323-20130603/4645_1 /TAXON_ID=236787 /ORGANISM="Florenciella parvula, Strain RCC1693" /LENGTH=74 /DNA_ID=CAMNT_0024737785 /DNA_START=456 /DNA_END=681 /DNA_ORIENTATION=-